MKLDSKGNYILYLRKSREDLDYEKENPDYQTLERHKKRLIAIANTLNINIDDNFIFEEVVSGDSISERPIINNVLNIIEDKHIKGVLVIDVQRLTRGDLGDQDKIIKTFKYTNTLIITPEKEYNLQKTSDEEYLVDKLAYSRKEYLGIKKRLAEGRKDSISEGKFVGSVPAFGYERYKLKGQKGWSLHIKNDEAEIVKLIFKKFIDGKGTFAIANELNSLGIKSPKGSTWRKNGIREMLKNQTYIGKVKWQERKQIKIMENATIKTKTVRQKIGEYQIVDGLHEAIIDINDFNKVQELLRKSSKKYVPENKELKNPLAGIVRCAVCNKVLARRDGKKSVYYSPRGSGLNPKYYDTKPIIYCTTGKDCKIKSHTLDKLEFIIIESLKNVVKNKKIILENYKLNSYSLIHDITCELDILNKEIKKEYIKVERIKDFLEEGIYDKKTYLERYNILKNNIDNLNKKIDNLKNNNEELKFKKLETDIPKIEIGIENYFKLDIQERNEFLHTFIEKVIYKKTKGNNNSDLTIDIYVKF